MLNLPRRLAAWWLATIGLLCASFAYQGLMLRSLVLDPDLAVEATSGVLSNETLQEALAGQVAKAMTTQLLPEGVQPALRGFGVDAEADLRAASLEVVSGPEFEALYSNALRDLHRYVFTDHDQPPVIDASSLVAALRARAIEVNPAYAQYLPTEGPLRVTATERLPDLTGARRSVDRTLGRLLIVAVGAIGAAFALHPRRDVVLRRLGRWLVSITVLQVGVALVAPVAVRALPGEAGVLAGAVLAALLPRLLAPALTVLLFGVGAIVIGRRWRAMTEREGQAAGAAAFLDPEGRGMAPTPPPDVPRGVPAWAYRTDETPAVATTAAPEPPSVRRSRRATPPPTAPTGRTEASVFPEVSVFAERSPP